MQTCKSYVYIVGNFSKGKSSLLNVLLRGIFDERYNIRVGVRKREMEEALRRDLARKTVCFVYHPDVSPICSRTICRIDGKNRVEKEKRYASVELALNKQIESIEKISFSRLHILFQNNIVNSVDTVKSFVCDNISAFKNMHAEGQVRSLIPLKKGTTLKLIEKEKQLHRPYLLFICKKCVLHSSVKKKQIRNCKSNSTLKNLYYRWTSVFANLVIMQRQEDSRIFV